MLGFIIFASKHYTCPVLQLNHGLSESKFHISWFKRSYSKVPHFRRWRYLCWWWFTLAQKRSLILCLEQLTRRKVQTKQHCKVDETQKITRTDKKKALWKNDGETSFLHCVHACIKIITTQKKEDKSLPSV